MNQKWYRSRLGWLPDLPDIRDYTAEHDQIRPLITKTGKVKAEEKKAPLPEEVDLREWCAPVEDQGTLGSCTANAAAGLLEYFERRAFNKYIDASRLFLYKTTRNLLHLTGDTGAYLRSVMGALVLFGAPPEEYWPYDINKFDEEPPVFCYAFAQNYQSLKYFRLDPAGTNRNTLLKKIKTNLSEGIPAIFGFTVYSSIEQSDRDGQIPFPGVGEKVLGGHAVMTVGFDDKLKITNQGSKKTTTGALLIRNSWGADWGDGGYGWLPYEYVLQGLAEDWWALLKAEWVDTGMFGE